MRSSVIAYQSGHIPGALQLSLNALEENPALLESRLGPDYRSLVTILYCNADCTRADKAASILTKDGCSDIYVLEGGFPGWKRPGSPLTREPALALWLPLRRSSMTKPKLVLIIRLGLGLLFMAAAVPKIAHPQDFAEAISNYRILSPVLIPVTAVTLPWLELLAGLCSLSGLWWESGVFILAGLSLLFSLASTSALLRGLDISCGCFQEDGLSLSWTHPIGNLLLTALAGGCLAISKTTKVEIPDGQ